MIRSLRAALMIVLGTLLAATGAGILDGTGILDATGPGILDAEALGGLNTVTVSPPHGQGGSSFSVTYAISPCQSAAGLTIGFSWGALPTAGQVLGMALTDANCRATLSSKPPVNAASHQPPAPGNYQVFGYIALPTGGTTPNTEASASYTIDVAPTPSTPRPTSATATASASATAHATASAQATATAPATATAHASATGPSASTPVASASGTTASALAGSPGTSVSSNTRLSHNPLVFHVAALGPWTLDWRAAVGVTIGLLLFAALTLFTIAIIRRRTRAASAGATEDKAA